MTYPKTSTLPRLRLIYSLKRRVKWIFLERSQNTRLIDLGSMDIAYLSTFDMSNNVEVTSSWPAKRVKQTCLKVFELVRRMGKREASVVLYVFILLLNAVYGILCSDINVVLNWTYYG